MELFEKSRFDLPSRVIHSNDVILERVVPFWSLELSYCLHQTLFY